MQDQTNLIQKMSQNLEKLGCDSFALSGHL